MASAIGTALMPTQGSCLPVTSISTSSPSLFTVLPFDPDNTKSNSCDT